MAAVSVSFDGTRWTDAEALAPTSPYGGDWEDTGGGAAAQEPDFVYQNTYSVSEKVKGSELGIGWVPDTALDMATTKRVLILKCVVTTVGILETTAGSGANIEVGSGGRRSAYFKYRHLYGPGGTPEYPSTGSWQVIAVDPNVEGHAFSETNTVSQTAINWVAWMATMTVATAKSENVAMDAIDYITHGTGLTLVGGDGADADGTFADFQSFDQGTSTNRYGLCNSVEGVYFVVGVLTIGSSTETDFTDSSQAIIFPDNYVDTGFCGIDVSLANTNSVISLTTITMVGKGSYGADGATADTRPDFGVTGTSGALTVDSCAFTNFNAIVLTSGVTFSSNTLNSCESLTQASATISGAVVAGSTTADGVAFITCDDITKITSSTFAFSDGHAIELTSAHAASPTTHAVTSLTYTGAFGGTPGSNLVSSSGSTDAMIYNNSGKALILNITGGDSPSIRNGVGATTTVNVSVSITITVTDADTDPIATAQTSVHLTSDDSEVLNADTNASGVASGSFGGSTPAACYVRVRKSSTGDTKYISYSTTATIASSTGLNLAVTLQEDPNA
ncbi:MAG: hypothetical protein ABFQ62_00190 [Patescibacteria group bacterium]